MMFYTNSARNTSGIVMMKKLRLKKEYDIDLTNRQLDNLLTESSN